MTITLGSLFDGIGVFPLAASRHGITPIWASEIVPDAISITKRHFPEMEHLGDITKLDVHRFSTGKMGGMVQPMDRRRTGALLCLSSVRRGRRVRGRCQFSLQTG